MGPLPAKVTLVEHEWEKEFDDRGVWIVQTGEPGETVDYGVVSDGHGFDESPDCERISGGVNSKGPYAVAIGRQANMLQWGFYAAPDRMTESAQQVFLNALVYMTRFDGHAPLTEKVTRGRTWLVQHLDSVRDLADMEPELKEAYSGYLSRSFPAGWVEEVGLDADALAELVEANLEYVHQAEGEYDYLIDATLQELGVSNRAPAFLAMLEERLGADPTDPVALELAARYLGEQGRSAKQALGFLREHDGNLFFSDTGGYRWLVDPYRKSDR